MRLYHLWILIIAVCGIISACKHEEPDMIDPTPERYQNWYVSEGKLEKTRLNSGGDAAELVGKRVVITRRLKHLDPKYDAPVDEFAQWSQYIQVPYINIVGKAEKGVSMSLVVEAFEGGGEGNDGGIEDEDLDAGSPEIDADDTVSRIFSPGAVITARHEISFALEEDWDEVGKELPMLPYDPTIDGYEVHISIVKKGKGQAFFYSGLLSNEGKLKQEP